MSLELREVWAGGVDLEAVSSFSPIIYPQNLNSKAVLNNAETTSRMWLLNI